MKNNEENWYRPEDYQGRSQKQVENNARIGGYTVVLFIIVLIWYEACELIKWLT